MKLLFATVALTLASVIAAQASDCPDGEIIIKGSCGKCPPGKTYDQFDSKCVDCDSGTFKASEGQGRCASCPPKSFSMKGATACITCREREALLSNGKCGTCPPGKYYDSYDVKCKNCRRNTFQPDENVKDSCFSCSGDTHSPKGATMCTSCPAGQVLMKDGTCGACPPGTYYDRYRPRCVKCSRNTFQPNENIRESCIDCSGDTHSPNGAIMCTKCPAGEALMKDGTCGACPPGTYYDRYGPSCDKCSRNTFQPNENIRDDCIACSGDTNSLKGATMCTTCPAGEALMKDGTCGACPPGTYYDRYRPRCVKCSRNTFQPNENTRESCIDCSGDTNAPKGATMCTKCPTGQALMKDGTCGVCPSGTGYDSYRHKCDKCGFNEYSTGKGIEQFCKRCPNSFYANKGATECFTCPDGQALLLQNNRNKGQCGACPPGSYYADYNGNCSPCGEDFGDGYISPGGSETTCTSCEDGTRPNRDRSACV